MIVTVIVPTSDSYLTSDSVDDSGWMIVRPDWLGERLC